MIIVSITLVITILNGCINQEIDSDYTNFANCLTETGAKMYGASWCSYCNDQKDMFGESWIDINYIECSLPDGGQTQICQQESITGYPTWEFGDGSRRPGKLSFEELSTYSNCDLDLG